MSNRISEIEDLLPFEAIFSMSEIVPVSSEAISQLSTEEKRELELCKSQKRKREFVTSRITLKKMVQKVGDGKGFEILKDKLGQPVGKAGAQKFFVSIAHTDDLVFCGLSLEHPIGIDLEPVDRTVPVKLGQRITHPKETDSITEIPLIRLWTLKEAYIKLRGRGLRMNMNEVCIERESDRTFTEINNDKRAKICSFELKKNWLAVAYYH